MAFTTAANSGILQITVDGTWRRRAADDKP